MNETIVVEKTVLRKVPGTKRKRVVVERAIYVYEYENLRAAHRDGLKFIKEQLENFNPLMEGLEADDKIRLQLYKVFNREFIEIDLDAAGICMFDSNSKESMMRLDSGIESYA